MTVLNSTLKFSVVMSINLHKILLSDSIDSIARGLIIALVVEVIRNVYSRGKTSNISVVP